MSPFNQARAIFRATKNDPAAQKLKKDQYKELVASITGADGGMQITDSQVNGQGFTAKHSSTAQERLQVLDLLMGMYERGSAGSKTTLGRFR